jgi:hypothetical protein
VKAWGCFGLTLLLLTGAASAQSPNVKKADELFREGRALMKSGDFESACPKLEESYRLDPGAGTAVNVGDCNDQFGKVASALRAYQAAAKLLAPGDPRNAPVREQIEALKKRSPWLTIMPLPDAPEGTAVSRNGKLVDPTELGRPFAVDAGKVTVAVTSPGRADFRRTFRLAEGDNVVLDPMLGAPLEAPDAASDSSNSGWSPRTTGYVVGGIGAVALTTGIATGLMANAKHSVVEDNCDASRQCNQTGSDAAQSGRTLNTVSYVGWGVGIAGIAAGGYFFFFAEGAEPTTAIGASASREGGQFTLRRSFW